MSSPALTLDTTETASPQTGTLLVCLPSFSSDALAQMHARMASVQPGATILFAVPEGESAASAANESQAGRLLALPVPSRTHPAWILTASDYAAAAELAQQQGAAATLILGSDAESLSETALHALSSAVFGGSADVAFPRYTVNPHEALVSAALLYPLTRTLFAADIHLPLPLDFAFSARAAGRLASTARRLVGNAAGEPLLWPAAEAAVANLRVTEVASGPHALPPPEDIDLNTLLAEILGSAFTDIEAKAVFWQRARIPSAAPTLFPAAPQANTYLDEITPMVESFRNAFANLQQIWGLVLPPHSLLALKKLSLTPAATFRMPPSLWARTVYEFVLAFHLRTLNRGHLLGALTPLYLGWVASYLGQVGDDPEAAAALIEQTAAVFEAEKPYLVSRWRWPDRFNP